MGPCQVAASVQAELGITQNTYGVFTRRSKHEANLEHTSRTCIFNTCFMLHASCLLHRVNTRLEHGWSEQLTTYLM